MSKYLAIDNDPELWICLEINMSDLNWIEMSKYLAVDNDTELWQSLKIEHLIAVRTGKTGTRPGWSSCDIVSCHENACTQWEVPNVTPGIN